MSYDRAILILRGMQEAGLISMQTKHDILGVMVKYGDYRSQKTLDDAVKIFTNHG